MHVRRFIVAMSFICYSAVCGAQDIVTSKKVSLDMAIQIAQDTLSDCREQGFQVAVVVVDRHANVQVAIRDDLASRFTLEIAERKANLTVLSGVSTGQLRETREDIRQELNHIDGIIMMQGGVPIRAGGALLGAVGVSGAPGGDIDEACAAAALDKAEERLEFAD